MDRANFGDGSKAPSPRRKPETFWHVTPLHYAPYLLSTGALYAQERLAALNLPILPRPTAAARDRKLRLTGYIHLSFSQRTPLLAHKRMLGYPHLLLAFDAGIADLPGAALLKFNAKAWRHREDFLPLTSPEEKNDFWEAWQQGRYPSAELLIPDSLPLLPHLTTLHAASEKEATWLKSLAEVLGLPLPAPLVASPHLFPAGSMPDLSPLESYGVACIGASRVLSPPDLPFD